MPKKFDRCVKKVKKQSPKVNPYAVCKASMKKKSNQKNHSKKSNSQKTISIKL